MYLFANNINLAGVCILQKDRFSLDSPGVFYFYLNLADVCILQETFNCVVALIN